MVKFCIDKSINLYNNIKKSERLYSCDFTLNELTRPITICEQLGKAICYHIFQYFQHIAHVFC